MGSFHQLGHHSVNLVADPSLAAYSGAILSPVNYAEDESKLQVSKHQSTSFECILDPQIYVPTSNRGHLPAWTHFPSDVDTADLTSLAWWQNINNGLVSLNKTLQARTIASPVILPRTYAPSYYSHCVAIADDLRIKLPAANDVLLSFVVRFDDLTNEARIFELASIASRTRADGIYLIFHSDTPGRKEYRDTNSLGLAGKLIRTLATAGIRVVVGYCGTDMVLWKHAGATDCATGKFWNLRRFSPDRWHDAEDGGGGSLPYWTEPSLLALLREGDLDRLDHNGLIPASSKTSPPSLSIVSQRATDPARPWVGLSWRQYLRWFVDYETAPHTGHVGLDGYLSSVELAWDGVSAAGILMEERQNDGAWVRLWRIAARAM